MAKIEHFILLIIAFCIKKISKNKLLILNYHRVQDKASLFFDSDLDHNAFDWQMHLISHYLIPISLMDSLTKLKKNQLAGGSIAVTFDDGYKDNFTAALPILEKRKVSATFFIATGFLNAGIMWNDIIIESIKSTHKKQIDLHPMGLEKYSLASKNNKLHAIKQIINFIKYKTLNDREVLTKKLQDICETPIIDNLMMTDDELMQLFQSGMEIGGHTVNHPILASETDDIIKQEILEGKLYLETLLNTSLTIFAYPNGKLDKDYQVKHTEILKQAGFEYAVTTNWGINTSDSEALELKRFTPWDKTKITFLLRILKIYLLGKV